MMEINQLLETLRLEEFENMVIVYDLESHANRLEKSIKELSFSSLRGAFATKQSNAKDFTLFFQNQIKNKAQYKFQKPVAFESWRLEAGSSRQNNKALYKTQIIYSRNGDFEININTYTRDLSKEWKVKILEPEEFQIDSKDQKWRHKFYPRPPVPYSLFPEYDELIWTNENGHICEGSFTNIFFQDDSGQWHTPHLDCGILPGTMRANLIKELEASEGFYLKNELPERILLVNSMFIKEATVLF